MPVKKYLEKKDGAIEASPLRMTEKQMRLIESFCTSDEYGSTIAGAFENMLKVVSGDSIREKAHLLRQIAGLEMEKELLELQIGIMTEKAKLLQDKVTASGTASEP